MLKLHRDSSFTPPESQNCLVGSNKLSGICFFFFKIFKIFYNDVLPHDQQLKWLEPGLHLYLHSPYELGTYINNRITNPQVNKTINMWTKSTLNLYVCRSKSWHSLISIYFISFFLVKHFGHNISELNCLLYLPRDSWCTNKIAVTISLHVHVICTAGLKCWNLSTIVITYLT